MEYFCELGDESVCLIKVEIFSKKPVNFFSF
jgi:hypothetical protein